MVKKPTPRKKNNPSEEGTNRTFEEELIVVSHLVKYNLYLLSKSIIFSSILQNDGSLSVEEIAELTNKAIKELDLASKPKDS